MTEQRALRRKAWRYYGSFYRGDGAQLLLTTAASIAQSFLQLPIVLLVRKAFDDVTRSQDIHLLPIIGAAVIALYLISGGLGLYIRWAVLRVTKLAVQRLRTELLHKFYSVSRTFHSQADHSRLHTMVVQDTERVDIMSNALIALMAPAVLVSAVLGAFMLYVNWRLFLVLGITMPLLIMVSRSVARAVREGTQDFHRSFDTFSRGMAFVLEAMDLTRWQSAEDWETRRQTENLTDLRLTSGRVAGLSAAYSLLQHTVVAVSAVLVLILGGGAVAGGQMTLGDLLSFFTAVSLLRTQLHGVAVSIPQSIEGSESLMRIYSFAQIRDSRPYTGSKRITFNGKITLSSVGFRYREDPVLKDVDLIIEPGGVVALVGPNGVGKSTIAYLVLGFYRPQIGRLYADDQPYDDLDIMHLRRQIGVVSQNPIIFPGTIWENITYGCPDPDLEAVREAAELSTAHDFVEQLPQGYDTFVGEHGVLLSGGQRQRIAIARALLQQPRLLILDEPTSHLDESAVRRLIDNLKGLDHITAKLIIGHDTRVIALAEHVYVLREGRVSASEGRE